MQSSPTDLPMMNGIQSIVLNYFSSVYQSDQPSQFSPVIVAIEKRVTDEMNDSLLKEF